MELNWVCFVVCSLTGVCKCGRASADVGGGVLPGASTQKIFEIFKLIFMLINEFHSNTPTPSVKQRE